jgi:hypothetical protein
MYYEPGSTMAHTCVRGNELMYKFCEENSLPAERCGKMIVATTPEEHKQVEKLYKQGNANGVKGLEIFDGKQVGINHDVVLIPTADHFMCRYLLWNLTSKHTLLCTPLIQVLLTTAWSQKP